jgi:DNA ligase-4
MIDFSFPDAYDKLSRAFARAITQRWEGLVLKAYDGPYFSLNGSHSHIKLKKDYIPGLGDAADFAIVGGRRDAKVEQELGIGKLWWTSFYIGCLLNKNDVCRFNARPEFLIVDTIGAHGISNRDFLFLNRHGYYREVPFAHYISEYRVELDLGQILPPTDLFKDPFVVELVGAGFDKTANSRYYTLRFPRIQKVHQDRSFKDTVSLVEMQELARQSVEPPGDSEAEEERSWLEKLGATNTSSNLSLVDEERVGTQWQSWGFSNF